MSTPKHLYTLTKEFVDRPKKHHVYAAGPLPTSIDLRDKAPPIFDQQDLGSCTSNAVIGAFEYHDPSFRGSRLFHYYCERFLDGDVDKDAGSTISRAIEVLEKFGCCTEPNWPYITSKFAERPPDSCFIEAKQHCVVDATHVEPSTLKACIANGNPVSTGIMVYESFESENSAKTGIIPMPQDDEKCLGGHAVDVFGYDDERQVWIMRNSWGTNWGDKGYFYLPYQYLKDDRLASDFWDIRKVGMGARGAPITPSFLTDIFNEYCCIS